MKKNKLIDYICKGDLNNLASKIHLPDEINICDSDRRSLLINAIIENQPKIITFLLEKGADVSALGYRPKLCRGL